MTDEGPETVIDVVVVAYNSRDVLRGTVAPLVGARDLNVIVVDNASQDDGLSTIGDLPVTTLSRLDNGGFAAGCNSGWRAGRSRYVLFLNPDAQIDMASISTLRRVLDDNAKAGLVGPLIKDADGSVDYSLRRFPRLRSRYAQALFLQRLFPNAAWTDEVIRDPRAYESRHEAEWISGACMLVRRDLLERLEGWDEQFFLYCEDIDLCKRVKDAGFEVLFEPAAVAVHAGGHSGSRPGLYATLAESRIRYARKHGSFAFRVLERFGIGLAALTHSVVSTSIASRVGHARSLKTVVGLHASRP